MLESFVLYTLWFVVHIVVSQEQVGSFVAAFSCIIGCEDFEDIDDLIDLLEESLKEMDQRFLPKPERHIAGTLLGSTLTGTRAGKTILGHARVVLSKAKVLVAILGPLNAMLSAFEEKLQS